MYLLLDTETTSYHPGQIAQLSYIHLDTDRQIIDSKNYFFAVDEMDPYAEAIHWFSKEKLDMLSEGKRFTDYQHEILPLLENTTLVAHNVWFDLKFMQYECERVWYDYQPETLCTMKHFTPICQLPSPQAHQHYKRPKVSELINHYNITEDDITQATIDIFWESGNGFHDARYDSVAVYLAMKAYNTANN
jgi:DNA polymerase-3 subunit epsilon